MKKNRYILYFIFVIGLFFCTISRDFLTEGMFMDGTYYSSISHKIATGQCSFWHLTFSNFLHKGFFVHPPLAFQTQSWFIKLFGDNFYCDKLYSVLTYIITGILICLIWKKLTKDIHSAWMPLLFWTTFPLIIWGSTNNLLENTMTIFIVASIYLCCMDEKKPYLWAACAGAMVYLAFMVKGPTALFPLVFPVIQYFFQKESPLWKYLLKTLVMTATSFALFSAMLIISEDSRTFFEAYYNDQIHTSFTSEPTVSNRFHIIWVWLGEILVGISIIIVSFIIRYKKQSFKEVSSIKTNFANNPDYRKNIMDSLKFLLLGLCGVIPIIVSMKQRSFYIIPAMPFFAISMALIFKIIFKDINNIVVKIMASVVIVAAIVLNVAKFGIVSRDKEMLNDIHEFEKIIPRNENILIPSSLASEYSLHGYYARYFDSTLTTKDNNNKYLILPKEEAYDENKWQSKYKPMNIETKKYNLYINESLN